MIDENQGNSVEDQLSGDATETDSSDFFASLDSEVNGVISQDSSTEATQTQEASAPVEATRPAAGPEKKEREDWRKRYTDSTREAQKMATKLNELKPFIPVLEAMKNDNGLVDHVRDYLTNGGASPNIKDNLGLDEDFVFDANEAVTDPKSDSAKLMNAHVDKLVQARTQDMIGQEKQRAQQVQQQMAFKQQEADFIKRHGMSTEEYAQLKQEASSRKLTLDDVYYLVNKDKADANIDQNARKDMMTQMKNVRDIPASASSVNNQGSNEQDAGDKIFSSLLGQDDELDNLFG